MNPQSISNLISSKQQRQNQILSQNLDDIAVTIAKVSSITALYFSVSDLKLRERESEKLLKTLHQVYWYSIKSLSPYCGRLICMEDFKMLKDINLLVVPWLRGRKPLLEVTVLLLSVKFEFEREVEPVLHFLWVV